MIRQIFFLFLIFLNILVIQFIKPIKGRFIIENNFNFGSSYNDSSIIQLNNQHQESIKNKDIYDLVDISEIDPSIKIDLKYSTKENFLKKIIYKKIKHCFLERKTANKLVNAQKFLKKIDPSLSLVVYDGARPKKAQELMWDSVKIDPDKKHLFLSSPNLTSLHNYGLAVDVCIKDKNGKELDMGCKFDSFDERSFTSTEKEMLLKGKLSSDRKSVV